MNMTAQIDLDKVTGWRRYLHRHPETAYEEFQTAAFVAERLREMGLEPITEIGGTGIMARIEGRAPGPVIGLRADMDALPLDECEARPHRSLNDGRMHACGHDGHTAILLGAAEALATEPDFSGTVVLVFQPAEEGYAGARAMLDDPCWPAFGIERIYGLHNWPELPLGEFYVHEGACMASSDTFEFTLRGSGGHAAFPHLAPDVPGAAASLAQLLSGLTRRLAAPTEPLVVTVTQIHTGTASNIIPAGAMVGGTVRCLSEDTRKRVEQELAALARHIGETYAIEATLAYKRQYPVTYNHAEQAGELRRAAAAVPGLSEARDIAPSMGAEDFSFFTERLPGAYLWLGGRDEAHQAPLHSCRFDFNDHSLPLGVALWLRLVRDLLPLPSANS